MMLPAIGSFEDQILRSGQRRRVAQDRPVRPTQVPGEDERPRAAVLPPGDVQERRPRDMTRLMEHDARALERLERLLVLVRHELSERPFHVLRCVERPYLCPRSPVMVPVHEFSVLDLDVGRVEQHGAAQVHGRRRAVDGAVETLLAEERDGPRVVDVGVRENHAIHRGRGERQRPIPRLRFRAPSLKETAVQEHRSRSAGQEMLGSGDGPRRPPEGHPHAAALTGMSSRGQSPGYRWIPAVAWDRTESSEFPTCA